MLFITTTALVRILSFLKETSCLTLLPWKSCVVHFHLISVTAGMAVSTHRTLSPDLFSDGMSHCVLVVSSHSSEAAGKHVFVNLGIGSDAKRSISRCETWIVGASYLPGKHTGSLQQFLSSIWVFWKQQTAWHFLLESHLKVQFYLIRVTSGMLVNTHRTLYPAIFSHQMVHCVPVVSIHHSENVQNIFLWTWELGPNGKISIFPLVKAGHFQP